MKRLAPFLLLPLFLVPSSAAGAEPATVERRVLAMGTEATLVVEADDRAAALAASEQALAALVEVEARLSTWSDDSELARLNAAPVGVPVALSPQLAADLALAAECRRATDGAFEPAVGALAAAWGLRDGGRLPGDGEIAEALAAAGPEAVELGVVEKAGATAVRRHAAARLEEGGFGKGIGLAAAGEALTGAGVRSAAVDLGGQLMLLGGASGRVAVADPRHRGRALAVLDLDDGSVATSGNGERGLVVDGRRLGHLLDPRSGRPAADFGSLTVWTADAAWADCLSTGLYVLGADAALAWAAARDSVEVLVAETGNEGERVRLRATPGLASRAEPTVAGLEVEIYRSDVPADGRAKNQTRATTGMPWQGSGRRPLDPTAPEGAVGIPEEYR